MTKVCGLWYYIWAVAKDGVNIDNRIVKAKQQKRIFTQKSILEISQKCTKPRKELVLQRFNTYLKSTVRYNKHESLILAQDERWRRA